MNNSSILTILNILSTISLPYEESGLISNLNDFFKFDHNIFLLDSSDEFDRFVPNSGDYSTPHTIYGFKNFEDSDSNLEPLKEIKSKNTFLIVVSSSTTIDNNLKLFQKIKRIQKLQINIKIGVFFSNLTSTDNVQKLFEWCWKELIVNIFATFYTSYSVATESKLKYPLNIFSYNPFGTFNVVNLSDNESYETFFLSKKSNFQQHPIRTAILKDTWTENSQRSLNYELANEKLWRSVFRVLNASIMTVEVDYNMDPSALLDVFDVFAYLYQNKEKDIVKIYPMTMTAHVLVVPEALPYREFSAYLKKMTTYNFFGYSLIAISTVWLLLSTVRYINVNKFLFFESACDVFNLLINDNGNINYRHLSRTEVLLIVPLTFAGFIIVSGVLSALQSFLTRPILQPQIDSVQDIYRSPFPILTWDEYWAGRLTSALERVSGYKDWRDKLHIPGYIELHRLITTYNTSMSFCWEEPRAKVLCQLQKRFNIRGYHISQTRTFNALDSYPLNDQFPFIDRLNEIILWIRSAGLYERWKQEEYNGIMKDVLKNRGKLIMRSEENEVDKFPLPMFICYGWCAGTILFSIEIIYKHFKLKTVMRRALKRSFCTCTHKFVIQ